MAYKDGFCVVQEPLLLMGFQDCRLREGLFARNQVHTLGALQGKERHPDNSPVTIRCKGDILYTTLTKGAHP